MLKVNLPDGSEKQFDAQITPADVAADIGPGLVKAALAAEVDGRIVGLDYQLPSEGSVALRILTKKDPESLGVMRHSCAHVMARAIMRLYDGVQLAFGPTIDGGFYYDFDLERALTEDDFPAIEAEMAKIIELDEPFERMEEPREQALKICNDLAQQYKIEHIQDGLAERSDTLVLSPGRVLGFMPRTAREPTGRRSAHSNCSRWREPIGRATPRATSCNACTALPSSTRRILRLTCSASKKPSDAIIACWVNSSSYSRSTHWSVPVWSCGCPRAP